MFFLGRSLPRNIEHLVLLCMLVKLFFYFEGTEVFVWPLFAGRPFAGRPVFQWTSYVSEFRYSISFSDGIAR